MKCPKCGTEFTPQVHNHKFCSLKCRTQGKKSTGGGNIAPFADLITPDVRMRNQFLLMPVRA